MNLKTHRLTHPKSAPTAAVGDLGLGENFRTHISIYKTSEILCYWERAIRVINNNYLYPAKLHLELQRFKLSWGRCVYLTGAPADILLASDSTWLTRAQLSCVDVHPLELYGRIRKCRDLAKLGNVQLIGADGAGVVVNGVHCKAAPATTDLQFDLRISLP